MMPIDVVNTTTPNCGMVCAYMGERWCATHQTGGKQPRHPVLNGLVLDVVAGGDGTALVQPVERGGPGGRRCTCTTVCTKLVSNVPAIELDDDFARSVVVHKLKLTNVPCVTVLAAAARWRRAANPGAALRTILLHNLQKLDHHLGGWPDKHLSLATLLCIYIVLSASASTDTRTILL